jgi:DNA-binding GntR family transcriptional regulator
VLNTTEKVQTITLRHQIVSRMRQAILDGSLAPGERVVERALAAKLGASVTAVREAVIQLEAEGLITKRSNTATNITFLTHAEITQTFAVRAHLERLAIAEAARRAPASGIRRLTEMHILAIEAAAGKDPRLYIQRDFAWHQGVWDASGNEVLAATLRRLVLPLFGFSVIQVICQAGFNLAEDAKLHTPILKAVERHDPDAAVAAFERGIKEWATHVWEQPSGQSKEIGQCSVAGD